MSRIYKIFIASIEKSSLTANVALETNIIIVSTVLEKTFVQQNLHVFYEKTVRYQFVEIF